MARDPEHAHPTRAEPTRESGHSDRANGGPTRDPERADPTSAEPTRDPASADPTGESGHSDRANGGPRDKSARSTPEPVPSAHAGPAHPPSADRARPAADWADTVWDVLVVGAGPAGSSAARAAAEAGASVLLLDRSPFPRYKTCGGGLLGESLRLIPERARATIESRVADSLVTSRFGRPFRLRRPEPYLAMVRRIEFDQALVEAAQDAGARFVDGVAVREITQPDDVPEVAARRTATTDAAPATAPAAETPSASPSAAGHSVATHVTTVAEAATANGHPTVIDAASTVEVHSATGHDTATDAASTVEVPSATGHHTATNAAPAGEVPSATGHHTATDTAPTVDIAAAAGRPPAAGTAGTTGTAGTAVAGATATDATTATPAGDPALPAEPLVTVRTTAGTVRARVVIGADGTGGRVGRYVGVVSGGVDLGLEDEIALPAHSTRWRDTVYLDWGGASGSYAWVFPKGGSLTVGVIQRKGAPDATRDYLAAWRAHLGLAGAETLHSSGHLTQWRTDTSPLRRDRVLVAGDAAGLLEPWTREGISFALRSGVWAGAAAAAVAAADAIPPGASSPAADPLDAYEARIIAELGVEMRAGAAILAAFERHRGLVHTLLRTRRGARYFVRFCRGETTLARFARHRWAMRIVGALG